jgi:hypothetical protein
MRTFGQIRFSCDREPMGIRETEVAKAEAVLKCRFPDDYREFVIQFGAGEFRDIALQVLPPATIVAGTAADQARLRNHWFWPDSEDVLSRAQAVETVACFDGSSGDDVRFHPCDPSTIFVLPHESGVILRVRGFGELVGVFRTLYNVGSKVLSYGPFRPVNK